MMHSQELGLNWRTEIWDQKYVIWDQKYLVKNQSGKIQFQQ
jgi:hypothetical protein